MEDARMIVLDLEVW